MTSISLVGDYDTPEAGFVTPSYGKPKDRRVDRKQVQTGLAVTGDGAIPVFHRAYDGKAGEVNQVVAAMEALKKMAGQRSFLLVGDSKLESYTNLAAIGAAGVTFVAPASKVYVGVEVLAGCGKGENGTGGLRARTPHRPHHPRRGASLPGLRGHHGHRRAPQSRPGPRSAPGVRVVLG